MSLVWFPQEERSPKMTQIRRICRQLPFHGRAREILFIRLAAVGLHKHFEVTTDTAAVQSKEKSDQDGL